MGDEIFVTENDLVATKRPWYSVGDGWTDEYKFVSGEVGISFVGSWKTGMQGVLGADSVEEDCYSTGNQYRDVSPQGTSHRVGPSHRIFQKVYLRELLPVS